MSQSGERKLSVRTKEDLEKLRNYMPENWQKEGLYEKQKKWFVVFAPYIPVLLASVMLILVAILL